MQFIATIGPASSSEATLRELAEAGATILRCNFSHGSPESVSPLAERARMLNATAGTKFELAADTKGPEMRTTDLAIPREYKTGEVFRISVDPAIATADNNLGSDYPYIVEDCHPGDEVIIDSGLFFVKVLSQEEKSIVVVAQNDAKIGSRRHINLPGKRLRLPVILDKERVDLAYAAAAKFEWVFASFVQDANDVKIIRDYLDSVGGQNMKIVSKIENQEGVNNIDEIVAASDAVMVARGDLGIEVPMTTLPICQERIIAACRAAGKPSILATEVLNSMIDFPSPTKAEINDAFNGARMGADMLMLSGETAIGKYPVRAMRTLRDLGLAGAAYRAEHGERRM